MAEPTKLQGKKPVNVKISDVAEIFSEIKRLLHHDKVKAHMADHTVAISPDAVNHLKDYIANAKLDAKSPMLKSVVNAPAAGANCPPDHCPLTG